MSDVVGTPTDELGGLSLYQADSVLPDYVSDVGSSVSQTKKTTVEVDAAMFHDAVTMVTEMRLEVRLYIHSFGDTN